tara:strand:+ start:3353 stop:3859 length:507 start_codon:yes stop_codon:yes gene_type:complete
MNYKNYITEIPNFPIDGVGFKDLSPLISNEKMFKSAITDMGNLVNKPDYWIGVESRGFVFASALAIQFGGGVVCARKEGKVPTAKHTINYDLEYGSATLEMAVVEHLDSSKVVIVDDVLATGGTLQATNKLANEVGYDIIDNLVLVDLKFIPRTEEFNINVKSVINYE